jgi:hypothetical protein
VHSVETALRVVGRLRRTSGARRLARAVAFGLGISTTAWAQSPPSAPETIAVGDWQLAPTAQLRTRAEYRHDPPELGGADLTGRESPRVRDAWGVLTRARLGLGAERGLLKAQITLQDARIWGSPTPTATLAGSTGAFGAYEAYFEARTSSANPSFIRVGRQAVQWGEGRLLGYADWSPVARSLDAVRGRLVIGSFEIEGLASMIDSPRPFGVAVSDTLGPSLAGAQLHGVQVSWLVDPLLRVEASGLLRFTRSAGLPLDGSRLAASRVSGELYTMSLRVSGEGKGWKYGAQGAYQTGTASSAIPRGADIEAFAFAGHVSRTFDTIAWTPTLRLGGSFASGDDGSDPSKFKQFDPLLADPHTWHGAMDLFAWSNAGEGNARVTVVPWTDTSFGLDYRYARLVESRGEWVGSYLDVIGREPGSDEGELGHEIDAMFTWKPWPALELLYGYSYMRMGEGARMILSAMHRADARPDGFAPARNAHMGYLQATLNIP